MRVFSSGGNRSPGIFSIASLQPRTPTRFRVHIARKNPADRAAYSPGVAETSIVQVRHPPPSPVGKVTHWLTVFLISPLDPPVCQCKLTAFTTLRDLAATAAKNPVSTADQRAAGARI